MDYERYNNLKTLPGYLIFTFISQGKHGDISKIVRFQKIDDNLFNLELGTILPNGALDFTSITNNGDRNKILATVADIVDIFSEKHPGQNVYIKGSDNRRTMLYQRAINYGYDELIQKFNIYGEIADEEFEFEIFDPANTYSAFLIERK